MPAFLLRKSSNTVLTVCTVYALPKFLLLESSILGPTVCVRLTVAYFSATCHFNSRSQTRCPSICFLLSSYLPDCLRVSQSVSAHLLRNFLLPASSTPGLTVCVIIASVSLPATCQFNSRSHSQCPSTCSLPSCYLPIQLQVSKSVSVSTCCLPLCYLPIQIQVSQSVSL